MDESCAHELYPAGSLADTTSALITEWTRKIDLHSWFDKREVSRTHAYIDLFPEYIREHRLDRELQVPDTDALIDDDTLDLIKGILVSSIDIFIAKYTSDNHRAYGWSVISHDEILHAGGLGRENISLSLEPECVLHITRRVILGDIDCIEIQVFSRHLSGFVDIESHSLERIFDVHAYSSDRMEASSSIERRNSDIFPFIVQF